jgi:hypothetical protein
VAWIRISESKAILHPLYGVRGWLTLFVIGLFLGAARLTRQTSQYFDNSREAYADAMKITGDFAASQVQTFEHWLWSGVVGKYSVLVVAEAIIGISIIFALFIGLSGKKRWFISLFNAFFIWSLVKCALLISMLKADNLSAPEVIGGSIGALVASIPWLIYVNVSRRVHITTRNEIRNTDSFEDADISEHLVHTQLDEAPNGRCFCASSYTRMINEIYDNIEADSQYLPQRDISTVRMLNAMERLVGKHVTLAELDNLRLYIGSATGAALNAGRHYDARLLNWIKDFIDDTIAEAAPGDILGVADVTEAVPRREAHTIEPVVSVFSASLSQSIHRPLGMAGRLGQVIYWFFCIVAAAILLVSAWVGRDQFNLEGFFGVCGCAFVAWLIGRAFLYVLAGR